jgi:hypothetical protein
MAEGCLLRRERGTCGQHPASPIVLFNGIHVTEDLFADPWITLTKPEPYRGVFTIALDPSRFSRNVHLLLTSRHLKAVEDLVF